ncbi:MAG TPA: class I SAM-dependent methyltransferase [Gemmatimonadaceae bacterium]|nr:class I SAM-dependent methyltransferase [Gemmatimonadaceae bacterium]
MSRRRLVDVLFDVYYSKARGYGDATIRFHNLCAANIPAGGEVLEIGAGSENETSTFLATLARVTAVDVSDDVMSNPSASAAFVFDGSTLPFADNEFDACVSNYVLEHVADPQRHFAEVRRVLKPGAKYIVRTPNLLHYVAAVSHALPHGVHVAVANRLRNLPAESHDPWPTVYRANRPRVLRRLAENARLSVVTCVTVECEPSYAKGSALLFFPMMLYERLVNSSEVFSPLRASINAVLRKH